MSDIKPTHFVAFAALLLLAISACSANEPALCGAVRPTLKVAPILNAIGDGQIKQLVGCGLDPNQSIPFQGHIITPLQFAAASGRSALVRQVVQAGADPNFGGTGEEALPPLELALSTRKYEAALVLLELGARADYLMPYTRTTSLMALAVDKAPDGQASAIGRRLVKSGAGVNATDSKGNAPLHWSARSANEPYAMTLLLLGADACLKNDKGQRPADLVPPDITSLRASLAAACKP